MTEETNAAANSAEAPPTPAIEVPPTPEADALHELDAIPQYKELHELDAIERAALAKGSHLLAQFADVLGMIEHKSVEITRSSLEALKDLFRHDVHRL